MMTRYCKLLVVGLLAVLLASAGVAQAGIIPVPDNSFENHAMPAVGYTYDFSPWVGEWCAVYDPAVYSGLYGEGSITNPDGLFVGYLNPGNIDLPGHLYQTLTDTFKEGMDYDLTVGACMYQNPGNEGQFLSIRLGYWSGTPDGWAGPTIVAERRVASSELLSGTLADFTASITSSEVPVDAIGKPIVVYLGKTSDSVAGPQWSVDNVRLVEVPEPGTIALLSCGLIGLAAFARRKR